MRILLAAAGSRGDIGPFTALGLRLQEAGHEVRLITHGSHAHLVPPSVPVVPADSNPDELMRGPAARALRRGDLRGLNRSRAEFAGFLASFAAPARAFLPWADALVASTFALAAVDEAVSLRVPVVRAHLWPQSTDPSAEIPLLPGSHWLPPLARRGVRAGFRVVEPYLAGFDGGWRRGRLRLNPFHPAGLDTQTHGTLWAVSPLVLLRQEPGVRATGWWTPPRDTSPVPLPPASPEHPSSGPAEDRDLWVAVGFGSMPQEQPEALFGLVSRAADAVGMRALVQIPGTAGADDGVARGIGPEPHDQLFSRVALAVHHGGSGTTGSVLAAGIPSVVVPHFADQYYWGHRLHRLGAGARSLPRPVLTRDRLARRIEQGLREDVRGRAAALGERIRAEDGTGTAVEFLEQALGTGRNRGRR